MINNDKQIAYEIICAQACSDVGKSIYDLCDLTRDMYHESYKGYQYKDTHIIKAIKLILKSKKSNFRFFIVETEEFDYECFIIYFNYRINGERKQISFHSFSNWSRYTNKPYSTEWDYGNSRMNAIELAKAYKISK